MNRPGLTLPLFWKFTIAIVAIVALFGSINAVLIWRSVTEALERELEKRGEFIARNVAVQAASPVMYDDVVSLQRLVDDVVGSDVSVEYAFILDGQGRVVAHTFDVGVPSSLVGAHVLEEGAPFGSVMIAPKHAPGKLVRDIAAPIIDRSIGTIRVGLTEEGIHATVKTTVGTLLAMVAAFLVAGIGGALIFAYIITNPIKAISSVADTLTIDSLKGDVHPRILIRQRVLGRFPILFRARDEIDLLAEKFNGMIERLERTYADLQTAQASLLQSEKLASIGTLAAGIAHEINNPIAGMKNCLRRIVRNPTNMEQNQKYLHLMAEATSKIESVVQRLLNYARKHDDAFQPVHLPTVIENALLLAAYRLEKARVSVEKQFPDTLPEVHGIPNQLEQVFLNLFINSIDAIEDRQRTQPAAPRRLAIRMGTEAKRVTIAVEDSGVGIPAEQLPYIFDPFFTSKEVGKGTGLGLSICHNIITEHRGSISVSSIPDAGTTVTITLPAL